jgi:hypothetical protein
LLASAAAGYGLLVGCLAAVARARRRRLEPVTRPAGLIVSSSRSLLQASPEGLILEPGCRPATGKIKLLILSVLIALKLFEREKNRDHNWPEKKNFKKIFEHVSFLLTVLCFFLDWNR